MSCPFRGQSTCEAGHLLTQGSIPIHERVELPETLIPADSRVEIDAKITAGMFGDLLGRISLLNFTIGYFTAGKRMTAEELKAIQGRMWEE